MTKYIRAQRKGVVWMDVLQMSLCLKKMATWSSNWFLTLLSDLFLSIPCGLFNESAVSSPLFLW